MMKKLIIVLVAILALPSFALAAYNDVTFPENAYAYLSADDKTIGIDSSTQVASMVVNTGNIVFSAPPNSIISLWSTDRMNFNVTGTSATYMTMSETCGNDRSTYLLIVSADAPETYTVTVDPSGSCSGGGGTTGPPGGGGGGGAGAPAAETPAAVAGAVSLAELDTQSSGGGAVSLPAEISAEVTETAGGEAALADNSVAVSMPANAVSGGGTISITPQANYAQPSVGYAAVGSRAYSIKTQVAGTYISQLAQNASLTFKYTDAQVANVDESTLVVSYWAEETGDWVNAPTTIDAVNNTVTATVSHFTKFILQGKSTTVPAGSLIKTADSPAVYYLGHDNKRYVFPDDKVYFTWYTNFNDVVTISNSQMISFSLGGNVTVRPGTKLIQFVAYDYVGNMIVDDPHVYAVEPGGTRHWIETAEIASALYGSAWEQKIVPAPNYLIGNYAAGSSIAEATYPTGSLVKETSTNSLYYISNAQKQLVTTNGRTSNKFQEQYYLSATSLADYVLTTSITDYQNSISWTAGK